MYLPELWTTIVDTKTKHMYLGDLQAYVAKEDKAGYCDENKDDYIVRCPYCMDAYKHDKTYEGPYMKQKLYIKKDYKIGHCFRCDRIFLNYNEDINVDFDKFNFNQIDNNFQVVLPYDQYLTLDMFKEFDDYSEKGMDYLIHKRHKYFRQLQKILNIKFSNNCPVIPFYFHKQLIYYQIKMAFGGDKPYMNQATKAKPLYIIERGENKKFVICEGTFDAIACLILYPDRTPVASLGYHISPYQINMLRTYVPEDILIYMDETSLSVEQAEKIKKSINYANVSVRPSNGQDPEEYLKYLIKNESI